MTTRQSKILNGLESRGFDYQIAFEYGEPGYSSDNQIILGNWNNLEKSALKAVESAFEIEWADEWLIDDGGRAFRSSPDSYSWEPSFFIHDGEIVPHDSLSGDVDELRDYGFLFDGGHPAVELRSVPPCIDLSAIAERVRDDCETGWHPGQTDSPSEILKTLPAGEYCFQIDGKGQFDVAWSVWRVFSETEIESKRIVSAFDEIMLSEVFRLDGPAIDLPEALIELGNAVHAADSEEIDWCLGEGGEADLASLIVGSYWSLSEWHGGQASLSYAALCSLGQVFTPGMESGPEEESEESAVYELVCEWFLKMSTLRNSKL